MHSHIVFSFCRVALLQAAVKGKAYLIDFIALEKEMTEPDWTEFARRFFCTENARKLGRSGLDFEELVRDLEVVNGRKLLCRLFVRRRLADIAGDHSVHENTTASNQERRLSGCTRPEGIYSV